MIDSQVPKPGLKRPWVIAGVVLLFLAIVFSLCRPAEVPKKEMVEEVYLPGFFRDISREEQVPVKVFYLGSNLTLESENREIYGTEELDDRLRQVFALLLQGPRTEGLHPLLSPGARLRELYLHEGCAYVDLEFSQDRGGKVGVMMEHLILAAMEETLKANFPTVERLKIVLDGKESDTLLGHIDIGMPRRIGGE
ncbi:MAG: GerMN domain-containing protein [bacterium]|nr:GerMN domain-containing protein [bacterium]